MNIKKIWHKISYLGLTPAIANSLAQRIVLTNQIAFCVSLIAGFYIFVYLFFGISALILPEIIITLCFISCLFLNKWGFFHLAKFATLLFINGGVFYFASFLGPQIDVKMIYYASVWLPLILFDPQKKCSIITGIALALIGFMSVHFLNYTLIPVIPIPLFYQKIFYFLIILTTFTLNIIGFFIFFSSIQKSEQKLRKAYNDLKQSKLLEERLAHHVGYATLTRGIAHELKNPMAMLQSRAEIVLKNLDDPQAIKTFADIIIRNMQRLKKLIHSMLEYSSEELSQKKESFSLNIMLEDLIALSEHSCKKKHLRLISRIQHTKAVYGNRIFIYHALLNILVNAIQYTPEEGSITLSLTESDYKDKNGLSHSGVEIVIEDTGIGIPSDILPRIFDPYFTTKSQPENTGLGLSLTFRVIAENNGHIDVHSVQGKGSSFKIYLPFKKKEEEKRVSSKNF